MALNGPGCRQSRSARSSHGAAPSLPSIGRMSNATTTSPHETLSKAKPMSSAEDSHVRTFPTLASAPELPAPVLAYGSIWYEPFAWYDRDSQSWRTWQRCLVGEWELFSETWPRSGRMRNGIAYRRAPLVPLTSAIASGSLLPTPRAEGRDSMGSGKHSKDSLIIQSRTWPTPRRAMTGAAISERLNDKNRPTPTTSMFKGSSPAVLTRKSGADRSNDRLDHAVMASDGGQLNPTWVEWLMGFPIGWTVLRDWATRSSRKSRKSSDEQS